MDYRKFLARGESLVLPFTGGLHVETEGRRLRVSRQVEPGWWTFAINGRRAEPGEPGDPPDVLQDRPAVRGHVVDGWLFASGRDIDRLELLPAEELMPLSLCRARRWYSGELLFDCTEFEGEAEEQARLALEERAAIGDVKGVSSSLRAAYGYALALALSRTLDIPISPREVQGHVLAIAEQGRPAAETVLRTIDGERQAYANALRTRAAEEEAFRYELREETRRERERANYQGRAEKALLAAGATPLAIRMLDRNQFEVTFRFMGQRFISVVDLDTLQVHDSGICLSGSDRMLTLESLPSAIREAIETSRLVIMRH